MALHPPDVRLAARERAPEEMRQMHATICRELDQQSALVFRLSTTNTQSEARLEQAREALRKIEWSAYDETASDPQDFNLCPECGERQVKGHAPDCSVGAALSGAAAPKEEKPDA
jgi:hypothetical protein